MKKFNLLTLLIVVAITFVQCKKEKGEYTPVNKTNIDHDASKEPQRLDSHETDINPNKPFYQGTVLETLDAASYTYVKIKGNLENHKREEGHVHKDFWIVVSKASVKTGDEIRFQKELVRRNYTSKILNKTFDELMFASKLQQKIE